MYWWEGHGERGEGVLLGQGVCTHLSVVLVVNLNTNIWMKSKVRRKILKILCKRERYIQSNLRPQANMYIPEYGSSLLMSESRRRAVS